MILFITLTRLASNRQIPVNAGMIAYLDKGLGETLVAFGSGESLRVTETIEEIRALINEAKLQDLSSPPTLLLLDQKPPIDEASPKTALTELHLAQAQIEIHQLIETAGSETLKANATAFREVKNLNTGKRR